MSIKREPIVSVTAIVCMLFIVYRLYVQIDNCQWADSEATGDTKKVDDNIHIAQDKQKATSDTNPANFQVSVCMCVCPPVYMHVE